MPLDQDVVVSSVFLFFFFQLSVSSISFLFSLPSAAEARS